MPRAITRIPISGGVNRYADPRTLAENEVWETKNLLPLPYGAPGLQKRLGTRGVLAYPHASIPGVTPWFLVKPLPFAEVFAAMLDDGMTTYLAAVTGVSLSLSGGMASNICRPAWMGSRLIALGVNGVNHGYQTDYNGSVFSAPAPWAFAGVGNDPGVATPSIMGVYRRRAFYLGSRTSGNWDVVYPSDVDNHTLIGDNAVTTRAINVGSHATDGPFMAGVEVKLSSIASPAESAFLILRLRAGYLLRGEPLLTTESGDVWGGVEISEVPGVDCAANGTVVKTPWGVAWMGRDDVWFMPHGSVPYRIGTKLRSVLRAADPDKQSFAQGGWDGRFLRFSVHNPARDAYDHWVLDAEAGIPSGAQEARWFGPLEYNIGSGGPVTKTPSVLEILQGAVLGGRIYTLISTSDTELKLVNLEHENGGNHVDSLDTSGGATSGDSSPWVRTRLTTRQLGMDTPNHSRLYEKTQFEAKVEVDTDFDVKMYPNTNQTNVQTTRRSASASGDGVNHIGAHPPPSYRQPAKYVQVAIEEVPPSNPYSSNALEIINPEVVFTPIPREPGNP